MLQLLASATRPDGSFDADLLESLLREAPTGAPVAGSASAPPTPPRTVAAVAPPPTPPRPAASAVEMELRRQNNSTATTLVRESSVEEAAANPTLAMCVVHPLQLCLLALSRSQICGV